ncbi:RHS repeat domain-containing protein [Pseudomonas sp. E102]|uniref:RHS repeat domain-containing protein n=1 Tax=Pseudomonas sp. E102 TaxID=181579 RepID=UPI004045E26A
MSFPIPVSINAPVGPVSPFTISGVASPGAKVVVYAPGGAVRYDNNKLYADANGNWSITNVRKPVGTYPVTAQQSLNGQTSGWSTTQKYVVSTWSAAPSKSPLSAPSIIPPPANHVFSPFTISGKAAPGAKVVVYSYSRDVRYDDDKLYADANGNWSVTNIEKPVGTYPITAQQLMGSQYSPWCAKQDYSVQEAPMQLRALATLKIDSPRPGSDHGRKPVITGTCFPRKYNDGILEVRDTAGTLIAHTTIMPDQQSWAINVDFPLSLGKHTIHAQIGTKNNGWEETSESVTFNVELPEWEALPALFSNRNLETEGVNPLTGQFYTSLPIATLIGNAGHGPALDLTLSYSAERFIDFGNWALNITYCRVIKKNDTCTAELFIANEPKAIEIRLNVAPTDTNIGTYAAHYKIIPLHSNNISEGLKVIRSDGTTEILVPFKSDVAVNRGHFYLVPEKIITKLGFALNFSWETHPISNNFQAPRLTAITDEQQTLFSINYNADSAVMSVNSSRHSHELKIDNNKLTEIILSTPENQTFKKTFTYSTTPGIGVPDNFKVMTISDSCGLATELKYGDFNKVVEKTDSIPTDIPSTTTYTYENSQDTRTKVQTVAEQVKTSIFEYDESHALKSVTSYLNDDTQNTTVTTFKLSESETITQTYHHSANTTNPSPSTVSTLKFDKNGNLSSKTVNNITTEYTYHFGGPRHTTTTKTGEYEVEYNPDDYSDASGKVFGAIGYGVNWAADNLTPYGLLNKIFNKKGFTWARYYEVTETISAWEQFRKEEYQLPVYVGTDGDPNYFSTYLECEKSYQIIDGKRVDLQWIYYSYRAGAAKSSEVADGPLQPVQKLTILRPVPTPTFMGLAQYQESSMLLESIDWGEDPSDIATYGRVLSRYKQTLDAGGYVIPSTRQQSVFTYSLDNDRLTTNVETIVDGITQTTQKTTSTMTGQLLSVIDELGNTTEYSYDSFNRVITQVNFAQDPQLRRETHYIYQLNGDGHTIQVIYPDNEQVREAYDALGRLMYTENWHAPTSAWKRLTEIGYNFQDQETSIREYDYDPGGVQIIDRLTKLTYDAWDNPLSRETVGAGTQYAQISPEKLTLTQWRKYPDGSSSGKVVSSYNTHGQVEKISFQNSRGSEYQSHRYVYDTWGCLSEEIPSNNPTSTYAYDTSGRMTSRSCNGTTIKRSYPPSMMLSVATDISIESSSDGAAYELGKRRIDGLGRVAGIDVGGRSLSFSYDGSSRFGYANTVSPPNSSFVITSSYDPGTGILTEFNTPTENVHNGFKGDKSATYSHSLRGLLLSETDVYGNRTEHQYDGLGRLSQSSSQKVERRITYDSAQRLQEEYVTDKGRNTTMQITYTYDDQDREIQRSFKIESSTLTFKQVYNKEGRLDKTDIILDNSPLRHELFTYDDNKRLYSYVCSGPVKPTDAHNNILNAQDFHYNALGGITEYTSYSDTGNIRYIYEYDTADRTQPRTISKPDSTVDLEYDASGQQTKDQLGASYTYDAAGNLLNYIKSHQQYTFLYDSLGRQSACEGLDYYERYFYNGQYQYARQGQFNHNSILYSRTSVLLNRSAGCRLMEQELKPDGGASEFSNSFEILDARGNLLASYDLQNQSFTHFAYTPFGYRPDSWENRSWLGFNGEPLDRSSGLYHLGNGTRSYSPMSQCFLAYDEYSPFDEGGINGYAYCGNDPINFSDPTGLTEVVRKYIEMPHQPLIYNRVAQAILMGGIGVALAPFTGGGSLGVAAAMTGLAIVSAGFGVAAAATSDSNPELSTFFDAMSIGTGLITAGKFAGAARGAVYKGMPKTMARSSPRGLVTMGGKMQEVTQINGEFYTFVDRYKGLDRLNVAVHGVDLNIVERYFNKSSKALLNNAELTAAELIQNLRSKGFDPSNYPNTRLLICFSANGGDASLAADFQRLTQRNVKAFLGKVTMDRGSTAMAEIFADPKYTAAEIRQIFADKITHNVPKTNPYSFTTEPLDFLKWEYKPIHFPQK